MIRKLSPALLAALAATALLAGCGSSSSSSNTTTTGSSTSSSSTAKTGPAKLPAVASAVANCKRGVRVVPTLSQSTKSRLEAICEKAASGDKEASRAAAREACEEIVKASPLPAGSARDRALSGCKSAAKK